jgi:hypothetical protein
MADDALEEAPGDREELLQAADVEQRSSWLGARTQWRDRVTKERHGVRGPSEDHAVRLVVVQEAARELAGPTGCRLGTSLEQRAITSGQRGWNGQPGGRLNGCGSVPAITGRRTRVSP